MAHLNGKGPENNTEISGRNLGKCQNPTNQNLLEKLGTGMGKRLKSGGGKGKGKRLQSGI